MHATISWEGSMKGEFLRRLLVSRPLCLSRPMLLLLVVPIALFSLLDVSPGLTNLGITLEQPKISSQGQVVRTAATSSCNASSIGADPCSDSRPPIPSSVAAGALDRRTPARCGSAQGVRPALQLPYLIGCNYAKGKWVADKKRPLYSGKECRQWLSLVWACRRMERTDFSYESYRWQPNGCQIPDFSGQNFLTRMRHKTLAFVGDSLGRQQFQSMICIATGGKHSPEVEDVSRKYGLVKAPTAFSPVGGSAYRFPSTNTTILFYWSATLSELQPLTNTTSSGRTKKKTSYALHLDRPAEFLKQHLHSFDALVLNTGHHWSRQKFSRNHWELYDGGKPVRKGKAAANFFTNARNAKLHSIARWLDAEVLRRPGMKVFLRTMSPDHFVDGGWDTGGRCEDTAPLSGGSKVSGDHSGDLAVEHAVSGTRVKLLDVTAISRLRSEGHISNLSVGAQREKYDCLHWCLPGVPDMWNEMLFAQI